MQKIEKSGICSTLSSSIKEFGVLDTLGNLSTVFDNRPVYIEALAIRSAFRQLNNHPEMTQICEQLAEEKRNEMSDGITSFQSKYKIRDGSKGERQPWITPDGIVFGRLNDLHSSSSEITETFISNTRIKLSDVLQWINLGVSVEVLRADYSAIAERILQRKKGNSHSQDSTDNYEQVPFPSS